MNFIEQYVAAIYATKDPIIVVVDGGRWEANGPDTIRSQFLLNVLQMLGGVNESVPPGTYHFNMKSHWFKMSFALDPVELDSPK